MPKQLEPGAWSGGTTIPNWLLARPEISLGAKVLYARLYSWGEVHQEWYASQEAMAEALLVSERSIRTWMNELTTAGLLASTRVGLGKNNTYRFFEHPWIAEWEPPQTGRNFRSGPAGISGPSLLEGVKSFSTTGRTSSTRKRTKSDADTDRPKLSAVPDDNGSGVDEVPEHLGGKSKPNSPTRRPGSGAGLAQHFRETLSAKYSVRQLGPAAFNDRALAKEFVRWMQEGVKPAEIRRMIAIFAAEPPPRGSSVWVSFKGRRRSLYEQAAGAVEAAERGERFRLPTDQTSTRTRSSR